MATFNILADQWNAWVYKNFGQDPSMIVAKMNAPIDLTKPTVIRNNTTSGMVHSIDGMSLTNNFSAPGWFEPVHLTLLPQEALILPG